jgi:cytochrome c oxidase subunit IV
MIDSISATYVIIGFLVIFGIILPILDKVPKIKNFVSLRWTLVVIYSALCVGVVIDFEHLDNTVRFAIVIGGIILAGLFVLVRSIEKASNNWGLPHLRTTLKKGDISAELSLNSKIEKERIEKAHKSRQEKQEKLSRYLVENENNPDTLDQCVIFTDDNK